MASIEFITKRIAGKEKEIDKLQKKLARIEKAEASGWEDNPYYYEERDKRYTLRDLEEAKKALEDYREQLKRGTEKAESRNVKVILEFLENWKARVTDFYASSFLKYQADYKAWLEYDRQHCEWHNNGGWKDPNRKEINAEYDRKRKEFYASWQFIQPYVTSTFNRETYTREPAFNSEKLAKDLIQEANAKYDDIIERTNEITGKITDASGLSVGEKGELNGYITGERGKAKVHTIGAGGYNIQCYHFRTLVHPMENTRG